jgi:Rieske Fe-S protein
MKGKESSAGPIWREEFSVEQLEERYVSRRQLAKFLTLTSLAMFIGQLWIVVKSWFRRSASAMPSVFIARVGEIPVGGVKLFVYPEPNEQCILIRVREDQYVAYSQKCTHLSCAVFYSAESRRLVCPCHEGYFSVEDGSVLQGPPPRPLPRVKLEQRGDGIVAVGMEGAA